MVEWGRVDRLCTRGEERLWLWDFEAALSVDIDLLFVCVPLIQIDLFRCNFLELES
jgi:hypothetical protein